MNIRILFLIGIVWLSVASCGHKKVDDVQKNYIIKGDTIVIPEGSNIKPKLKIAKATVEPYKLQIFSAAKITAIPNKYAVISAPFNGRIVRSFVTLGQNVNQGTPLFSIISSDFTDAQKLYLQARQQYLLADKDFKRQKDLLDMVWEFKRTWTRQSPLLRSPKVSLKNHNRVSAFLELTLMS